MGAIVVALAVLLGGAVAFIHSAPGERFVAGQVEARTAQQVELDGLAIDWPFRLRADHLRLKDAAGTWATVTAPRLDWHPSLLLRRVLDIDRLAADQVAVARLPAEGGEGGGEGGDLPNFALRLDELSAPVVLAPAVLGEELRLEVAGTFQMRRGGGRVDVHARVEGGGFVRVAGTAGSDYLDLRWYLQVPRLERWQALAGVPLAGAVGGSGVVSGRLPAPVLAGSLEAGPGGAAGLGWSAARLNARLMPDGDTWHAALSGAVTAPAWDGRALPVPTLEANAAGNLDLAAGRLLLGQARLTAAGMSVAVSGMVEESGRRAALRVAADLDDARPLLGVSGAARLRGWLTGDLVGLRLDGRAEVRSTGLATGTEVLDRLLGPAPRLSGDFRLDGRQVDLRGVRLEGAGGEARAEGKVTAGRLDLWLHARLPDLAVLAPELSGGAEATGHLGGAPADPSVAATARVAGLSFGGAPPAEGIVEVALTRLASAPAGAVEAALDIAGRRIDGRSRIALDPVRLTDLSLRSGAAAVRGALVFAPEGPRGRLRGSIPELRQWREVIGVPLAGTLQAEVELAAGGRLALDLTGSGLALDDTAIGDLRLTLNGTPEDFRFDLDAVRDDLRLATAGRVRRAGETGRATVTALNAERNGARLSLAAPAGLWWRPGRVALEPARLVTTGAAATLSGRLADGQLAGQARLQGDLAQLIGTLSPVPGHIIAGQVDGTVRVAGPPDAPAFGGRVAVTRGRYENLETGTAVMNLSATLTLEDERARLLAEGSDGGRGRVRLEGAGGFGGAWTAEIALDRFTALRRDDAEAEASGRLSLSGQGTDARIAGRLRVPRAEIDIGRLRGGGPVTLEVTEVGGRTVSPPEEGEPAEAAMPATVALAVEVAIEHAFVRGRGLDSEWQGELAVSGTAADPIVSGTIAAVRGQFEFLGRRLELAEDSRVVFQGDPGDPALDVAATARAGEVDARVEVSGSAQAPELAVTSDPPLPQDEVLARLLFGREAGELSAFQQIQLGRLAASGLTGGGDGFDPIGDVRGMLGLDVLEVGGGENGEGGPSLTAGKYIGRDTFVRVEQGTQGTGSVAVEQDLGGGFAVETEIGQQSGSGFGVLWRRNY
ncbi:exported hypothetical protein [Magnetospirillum sp. UT-4]|nr:exported hypothetical protein [Magnetospirillum sp. UT-4]